MKLYLVQHGLALSSSEDVLRPLSKEGRETVTKISRWAQQTELAVATVHHSGKLRAEQTATILAESLIPDQSVCYMSGLDPNDDVSVIKQRIHKETENIMLVGHLPCLNRLASLLLSGHAESEIVCFHNAAIVCLQSMAEDGGASDSKKALVNWSLDWIMLAEHVI